MQNKQESNELYTENDYMLWFENLIAPKHIETIGNIVKCEIGFNRFVKFNDVTRVVGNTIEVEASSIVEALRDAKLQYEFLATSDIFDTV